MNKSLLACVLSGALFLPAIAHADAPMELVIVTPTRFSQALDQSLADSTILDEQEIRNSGATDVPGLLKNLAGVEIYQNGGVGKQSSTFMRGSNSSHTLVLLDGVRINSATAGTTQIDQLMLDQIERIEVVRGNVSSVYGSDAIGGVIQIFTKKGTGKPASDLHAGAGTQRTYRASARYGGEIGNTSFNLVFSRFRTDGISAINSTVVPTVNPDRDGYDNTSISANINQALNDDHSLSVSLFDSNATNQTDNPFGLVSDVNNSKSRISKYSLASDNQLGKAWHSKLQISQGIDDIQNYLNGSPDLALGAQFKTTSNLFSWQNSLEAEGGQTLIGGVEHLNQRIDSSTPYTRTDRTDNSVFAGYTKSQGDHKLQVNVRHDQYSDFGSANTWLMGYGYRLTESWKMTAVLSTAFKAPTLNDLFYPFTDFGTYQGVSYSYVGNPGLKPERSRNMEIGVHHAMPGQQLDIVYFDNRIRDLIVGDNLPAGSMVNLSDARCDGIEMTYRVQLNNTRIKLAATKQNPRDVQSDQTLLRRAKTFFNVGLDQQIEAMTIGAEWHHNGDRTDIDILTGSRITLNRYDTINLTLGYRINKHLDLAFRAENALNRNYTLAHGYNTPGRTLFMSLNYFQ